VANANAAVHNVKSVHAPAPNGLASAIPTKMRWISPKETLGLQRSNETSGSIDAHPTGQVGLIVLIVIQD